MLRLLAVLALLAPASAFADQYPYVSKGPVILGVTQSDAWVAWYTLHHQGESSFLNACYNDALTGTPNDTIPTLTFDRPGGVTSNLEDRTCSRYHRVHMTNLQPGTTYTFTLDKPRASGGPNASGSFTTAPAAADGTVKFIAYGDNRDEPITGTSTRPDHQAVVDAMVAHETGIDFLLNTGDLALNLPAVSGDDNGYTGFWEVEQPLLVAHPVAVAFGNHESIDSTFYDGLFNAGTLSGAPHPYYFSFDWGAVHVAVLDAFEGPHSLTSGNDPALTDAQAAWLDADLAAAQARGQKLFLLSHQGAFSHGDAAEAKAHGGSPDLQAKVVPLMVKYGVLTTFGGHDHYYERGREACTSYNVVGAGGAPMYTPDTTAPGVAFAVKKASYLVVTVTPTSVKGEAKGVDGVGFDSFDFEPAGCDLPDAGTQADADAPDPDAAAAPPPDASTSAGLDAATPPTKDGSSSASPDASEPGSAPTRGCGCATGGPAGLAVLSVAALGFVARRRRR